MNTNFLLVNLVLVNIKNCRKVNWMQSRRQSCSLIGQLKVLTVGNDFIVGPHYYGDMIAEQNVKQGNPVFWLVNNLYNAIFWLVRSSLQNTTQPSGEQREPRVAVSCERAVEEETKQLKKKVSILKILQNICLIFSPQTSKCRNISDRIGQYLQL